MTVKELEAMGYKACGSTWTQGYDNGETVKLIHQLEDLGVDPEVIFDIDFAIRESHKE